MSATARAAGNPSGDRPGRRTPPPLSAVRPAPRAAGERPAAERSTTGERPVAGWAAPAERAREAREAGMVPAGSAAYLVVGEDGSVTLRGEAVPAEDPAPSEGPALPAPPVTGGAD